MDTAMTREELAKLFDQITREVTERESGICLRPENTIPNGELSTVYAAFTRGFHSGLSFCAETALFTRLTQCMMQEEEITPQDVEEFVKEYFNVLCGHIASRLFQITKVASRFGIPAFYQGQYAPEGYREHFVISYASDGNGNAQLIHHIPSGEPAEQICIN